MKIQTQTLGYPRLAKRQELKKALEAYWKGEMPLTSAGLISRFMPLSLVWAYRST